jgi:hypothetical protein
LQLHSAFDCRIAGNALSDTVCEAESYRQSSPFINFIWGAFNLVVGMGLISFHPVLVGLNSDCLAFSAGALLLGTYLSHHFGNVRGPEAKLWLDVEGPRLRSECPRPLPRSSNG